MQASLAVVPGIILVALLFESINGFHDAGVGTLHRLSAVRRGVAEPLVWAWILTIPMSGLVAAPAWAVIPSILPPG